MLEDKVRTTTYQRALKENISKIKDKIVLDIGMGTGILSYFAVQSGAKKGLYCYRNYDVGHQE